MNILDPAAQRPPELIICTDAEHAEALKEIRRLWAAYPETEDGKRLECLVDQVVKYEAIRWPPRAETDILDWLQDSAVADRVHGKVRLTVIWPDWFDRVIAEIVRLREEVERLRRPDVDD